MEKTRCNDIGQLLLLIPDQMPTRTGIRCFSTKIYRHLFLEIGSIAIQNVPQLLRKLHVPHILYYTCRSPHADTRTIAYISRYVRILIYERIKLDYFNNKIIAIKINLRYYPIMRKFINYLYVQWQVYKLYIYVYYVFILLLLYTIIHKF